MSKRLRKTSPSRSDPFLAQMIDPFEKEIVLPDNRVLSLKVDELRKRLKRLADAHEPACTLDDIGGL